MTVAPVAEAGAPRTGPIRIAGVLVLAAGAALIGLEPAWNARLASTAFDAYQIVSPRPVIANSALSSGLQKISKDEQSGS